MATLKKKTDREALSGALALARQTAHFPATKLWLDFAAEADVLYISLRRPQRVTETIEAGNGILLRYRNKDLVGITVLDASKRENLLVCFHDLPKISQNLPKSTTSARPPRPSTWRTPKMATGWPSWP